MLLDDRLIQEFELDLNVLTDAMNKKNVTYMEINVDMNVYFKIL